MKTSQMGLMLHAQVNDVRLRFFKWANITIQRGLEEKPWHSH